MFLPYLAAFLVYAYFQKERIPCQLRRESSLFQLFVLPTCRRCLFICSILSSKQRWHRQFIQLCILFFFQTRFESHHVFLRRKQKSDRLSFPVGCALIITKRFTNLIISVMVYCNRKFLQVACSIFCLIY